MKASAVLTSIILVLSLAIWCFFAVTSTPLQPAETTVVVGFCTLFVFAGKFAWGRIAKPRKKDG